MDQDVMQDALKQMEKTNKHLMKIAESLVVFKVVLIGIFIAILIFVMGNYLN